MLRGYDCPTANHSFFLPAIFKSFDFTGMRPGTKWVYNIRDRNSSSPKFSSYNLMAANSLMPLWKLQNASRNMLVEAI